MIVAATRPAASDVRTRPPEHARRRYPTSRRSPLSCSAALPRSAGHETGCSYLQSLAESIRVAQLGWIERVDLVEKPTRVQVVRFGDVRCGPRWRRRCRRGDPVLAGSETVSDNGLAYRGCPLSALRAHASARMGQHAGASRCRPSGARSVGARTRRRVRGAPGGG